MTTPSWGGNEGQSLKKPVLVQRKDEAVAPPTEPVNFEVDEDEDVSIDSVDHEFIDNMSWDTNSQEFIKSHSSDDEAIQKVGDDKYDYQLHNFKKNYLTETLPERLIKPKRSKSQETKG